jgi:hypothetical protein
LQHRAVESLTINMSLEGLKDLIVWPEGAKFPLIFEFTIAQEHTILGVEYSDEVFSKNDIREFVERVEGAIEGLSIMKSVGEVALKIRKGVPLEGADVKWGAYALPNVRMFESDIDYYHPSILFSARISSSSLDHVSKLPHHVSIRCPSRASNPN